MARVVVLDEAVGELRAAIHHYGEINVALGRRLFFEYEEKLALVAERPELFRMRDDR